MASFNSYVKLPEGIPLERVYYSFKNVVRYISWTIPFSISKTLDTLFLFEKGCISLQQAGAASKKRKADQNLKRQVLGGRILCVCVIYIYITYIYIYNINIYYIIIYCIHTYIYIYTSIYLSISLSVYLPIYLSIYLPIYLSIYLSIPARPINLADWSIFTVFLFFLNTLLPFKLGVFCCVKALQFFAICSHPTLPILTRIQGSKKKS